MTSKLISVIVLLSLTFGVADCLALTGKWRGDISIGQTKLPLVFNFEESDSGKTVATMDSPQQHATGIPLDVKYCSTDSISLECKTIGASYTGKITDDKIEGFFVQMGYKFPLLLSPELDIAERRPQTPQPPFPYLEKDTTFISYDGTELAGTLTIPNQGSDDKLPVLVMITGSGPQNRDEEIFEHRPFAVIADFLARKGIASFRYDDRGTASSKGDYSKGTIETFKKDAESALKFVRNFSQFNRSGVLGHSEGGTLAVLMAEEYKPDFIVSLAGMAVSGKETLLAQNTRALEKSGLAGKQKEDVIRLLDIMFSEISSQYRREESSPVDIGKICMDNSLDVPVAVLESLKRNNASRNGYFDSLVSLDPTESLKAVRCPVLAINGTKDTQVDADSNLEAFRRNVKNVEIEKMDGLNHLLQHAVTGDLSEYGEIRETVSPDVLLLISDFIINQR